MKYLVVIPDYTGSCIRDEFEGEIALENLELPSDILKEFILWHEAYKEIIPLNLEDRLKRISQIEKLDAQGLQLAKKLKSYMPEEVKVKYYSEGKLKFLHVE